MERLELLKGLSSIARVSIFSKLNQADVEELTKIISAKKYAADAAVFFQGDPSDSLYMLLAGSVKVTQASEGGREKILDILGPGEIFGEFAMLDGHPRSATVTTCEPTELASISHKDFRSFVASRPEVLWKVLQALCERVRKTGTEMLELSSQEVPYRLLAGLHHLAEKYGQVAGDGSCLISGKVGVQDLVAMVGSSREVVSRLLHRYQEKGLVELGNNKQIIIPDPAALARALEYSSEWPSSPESHVTTTRMGDSVHFAVTSHGRVLPGTSFVINVWAYLDRQYSEVFERARRALAGPAPLMQMQSRGPALIVRGTRLAIRVCLHEVAFEQSEEAILWTGDIANVTFAARANVNASLGPKPGTVMIYAEGIQIARINFVVEIGSAANEASTLIEKGQRFRSAFASYASADRNAVLARVQGIHKVVPDLDIFLDVVKLRSGQDWAVQISREIESREIFYLFWSENAKKSEWVEKEWKYALASRGLNFIDPVPLVSPDEVPPPPELAAKHFDDWQLAYMRGGSA